MNNSNLGDRLNSVRDTSDEKKLKRYALDDPSDEVREIAASKITDPVVLSYIVKYDRSANVAKRALKNIDDEYELKNLYMELPKSSIDYREKYLEIINKVSNVSYLVEMINFRYFNELLEKIYKINPNITLTRNHGKYYIKTSFKISHILDQRALIKTALNSRNSYHRELATKNILNQKILEKIALNDSTWFVRKEAVKKITNQKVLENIVFNDSDISVRLNACKRITDQNILENITINYNGWDICTEACKRITNQDALEKIGLNHQEWRVRAEAAKRIENQDVLVELALNDNFQQVQIEAYKRIEDQNILLETLLDATDNVVEESVDRINDPAILLEIALSHKKAAEKLDDETKILYEALKEVS